MVALAVALVPAAAPDRKPPRIVSAVMVDLNRNARADRMRLTYSERIRHSRDHDGKYTFAVTGYKVLAVGASTGRSLVVLLREHAAPDAKAHPAVRYRRTRSRPVRDVHGNQAVGQLFRATRAHNHLPPTPAPAPPPAPTPTPTPAAKDSDKDGYDDGHDCAPSSASIHPGASDLPDLGFVDSNCDGIDGTIADAIFVSPSGNDANPGTKEKPKRQIRAAVTAAGKKYVLVAFGTYGHVAITSSVAIYGAYNPATWKRDAEYLDGPPMVTGSPEGMLVSGAKDVVVQLLSVQGIAGAGDRSAYGIRAINGADVDLQRVIVGAGNGLAGGPGAIGSAGAGGGNGGGVGTARPYCDTDTSGAAYTAVIVGKGGTSPAGRNGGNGGNGGYGSSAGQTGQPGLPGTPGGQGGASGNPGHPGGKGFSGENGAPGTGGAGGGSSFGAPVNLGFWVGQGGNAGSAGLPGDGGGGGGGGGGQHALFAIDGTGNPAGGGGGGGAGGAGGLGGAAAGGSFGVYLVNSTLVAEKSSVRAGNGGAGGSGGDGGFGGPGGVGSNGDTDCISQVGAGGDGGNGGAGGRGGGGGGGAGGPSIGIMKFGASSLTLDPASTVTIGSGGPGGAGGSGGSGGNGGAGVGGSAVPLAQAS
jgi:hypothetical protein